MYVSMVTKGGLHTQRAITVACSPLSLSSFESESSVTTPIQPASVTTADSSGQVSVAAVNN